LLSTQSVGVRGEAPKNFFEFLRCTIMVRSIAAVRDGGEGRSPPRLGIKLS